MNDLLLYLLVFGAAAIPWFELFAIPPGIALGLSPVAVGAVAMVSNGAVTVATIAGWERLSAWSERRRGRPLGGGSRRSERARRAFDRFGVPGLALQGPVLSGVYLAAVLALSFGAPRRRVLAWSLISVVVWSVALVAATVGGLEIVGGRDLPGVDA